MKMRKRQISIFFIAIFILVFLNVNFVNAMDELFLRGELQSVDVFSKIATVDVKTQGCQDVNEFKVDDITKLDGLEGKTITFYIDSSTCKDGKVHTMHKIRLQRSQIR